MADCDSSRGLPNCTAWQRDRTEALPCGSFDSVLVLRRPHQESIGRQNTGPGLPNAVCDIVAARAARNASARGAVRVSVRGGSCCKSLATSECAARRVPITIDDRGKLPFESGGLFIGQLKVHSPRYRVRASGERVCCLSYQAHPARTVRASSAPRRTRSMCARPLSLKQPFSFVPNNAPVQNRRFGTWATLWMSGLWHGTRLQPTPPTPHLHYRAPDRLRLALMSLVVGPLPTISPQAPAIRIAGR